MRTTLFAAVSLALAASWSCSSAPKPHPRARPSSGQAPAPVPVPDTKPATPPLDAQTSQVKPTTPPPRPAAGGKPPAASLDRSCVASWEWTIDELVADQTTLYWAAGNKVVAWPKAGGEPKVLADLQADPHDLVLDDRNLYWLVHEAVRAMAKTGGPVRTLAPPQPHKSSYFEGLVIWHRELYLTAPINLHIWNVRCDGKHGLSIAARAPGCNRLATNGRELFAGCKQGVLQIYRNIVVPKQLVSTKTAVTNLAVDRHHLFWTELGRGHLLERSKRGGKPKTLARTPSRISSLALDARHVYLTSDGDGDGKVLRVAKRGGPVTVLASGQSHPDNVVVDSKHVYWSTQIAKSGCVVRQPKKRR